MTPDLILRDLPMPIYTPRLVIRPPEAGMGKALNEAKKESLTSLSEWFPWGDSSVEEDEIMLRKQAAKFLTRDDLMLLVFDYADRLVGCTGFHFVNNFETPVMHIGYWIRESEAKKGYVTEWVNALIRYGFEEIGLKKISIHCDSENKPSIAVPERLGFELEYAEKWGTTKPNTDGMRILNVYSRFDTDGLPPLNVTWENKL